MIKEFENFIEQFGEDENIILKFQHSLRVKDNCLELGNKPKVEKSKLWLSSVHLKL